MIAAQDVTLLDRVFVSSQCTVSRGVLRDGRVVAIKSRSSPELGLGAARAHEAVALARVGAHPSIIGLLGAYELPRGTQHLVLAWAAGGDLLALLRGRSAPLPPRVLWRWAASLFAALAACAAAGVIHRDVKSSNLLLVQADASVPLPARRGGGSGCVAAEEDDARLDALDLRLADFGVARVLLQPAVELCRTIVGTPFYFSPELVAAQLGGGEGGGGAGGAGSPYDGRSDLFSAGVVLYELASLRLPFPGSSLAALAASIRRGVYAPLPAHCSPQLAALVAACLQHDPAARPSAQAAQELCQAALQRVTAEAAAAAAPTPVRLPPPPPPPPPPLLPPPSPPARHSLPPRAPVAAIWDARATAPPRLRVVSRASSSSSVKRGGGAPPIAALQHPLPPPAASRRIPAAAAPPPLPPPPAAACTADLFRRLGPASLQQQPAASRY